MMYRRIMLARALWLAWSVPSSVKYRSAVNCASMRFNQDEFVGLLAISTLFAAAQMPARRSVPGDSKLTVPGCRHDLTDIRRSGSSGFGSSQGLAGHWYFSAAFRKAAGAAGSLLISQSWLVHLW